MTFGSLFAGIGGMDLGLERAGMQCKWQVENDPFCQKVLTKHWPEVPKYGDIREVTGDQLGWVECIAGGFPCQDLSCAGRKAGIDGSRSGLWSHYHRLIREIRPRFILIENVSGLLANEPMRRVLGDLSVSGYDAEWRVLRASQFGAPHERERVFVVAYPNSVHGTTGMGAVKDRQATVFANGRPELSRFWVQASNLVARMGDGVPAGAYRVRGEQLGNAVVPQVAEWIGRRIVEAYAHHLPRPR